MDNQRWLSMSYFVFFFTWGAFLPYWTGWLSIGKELSVTAASIIMGAGMLVRSFSTFLIFPYLTEKFSLTRATKWLTIISFALLLLYIPSTSFNSLLIITILFSFTYPMILPAVESSASILMQKERIHYGKSRSFGSFGFIVAVLIIGAATAAWNESVILYIMLIGLMALTLFFMRSVPAALNQRPDASSKKVNFKALFKSKEFTVVLTLAVLLQGAHAAYYNFGFIYLDDLGVNSFYIGLILNVAVLFEIVFFRKADRLLENMQTSTMFLIAALGSSIRWIIIYLFPYTAVFIGSQVLHAISFGVAHFAFIQYISNKLPNEHIAAAQGIYASFAMSLSVAFLTFLGGFLYEIEPGLSFLGMLICSIPAIIIVLVTRQKFHF